MTNLFPVEGILLVNVHVHCIHRRQKQFESGAAVLIFMSSTFINTNINFYY